MPIFGSWESTLKNARLFDTFAGNRGSNRKRTRTTNIRQKNADISSRNDLSPRVSSLFSKQVLVVVESEGSVFDTLRSRHEHAYLPAFAGLFSWGADIRVCSEIWRAVALSSRMRGENPLFVLSSALRLLNSYSPSILRSAVIKVLESSTIKGGEKALFSLNEKSNAERLVIDWLAMAEGLMEDMGNPAHFAIAEDFLKNVKHMAPNANVLVYSTLPEANALNEWEMAGLGDCFLRIAGAERGDLSEYMRVALAAGFDTMPILMIGSTRYSWLAAQSAGARFFPIMPGREEESWKILAERFFPAFLRGDSFSAAIDTSDFIRTICTDMTLDHALAALRSNG
jgi:hypothetical protein